MKSVIISIVLTMIFMQGVFSQQKGANISFDERIFDFGKFDETKGTVTHEFEFTNTGSEPLIIQNVSTSCGCTTPSWTKTPVKPGEKGFVSAAFDPKDRPGQFEKIITVTSTANPSSVQLKITGQVQGKPLKLEDQFPVDFGGIRLKSNSVSFGRIHKGQQQTQMIEMINATDKPHSIKIDPVLAHLKVKTIPEKLAPKQTGIIEISFNTAQKNDWGFIIDRLTAYVDGSADGKYRITSSAYIDEDFSKLTEEQRINSPVISFEDLNFNFGTLESGKSISHEYKFTNLGKSSLIIRKVIPSCNCTVVNTAEQVIGPGKTGVIRANFNSAGQSGKQNKSLTVISNDPVSPTVILTITGEIKIPGGN